MSSTLCSTPYSDGSAGESLRAWPRMSQVSDSRVAGERADVAVPHPPAGREAVAQQQRRAAARLAVHVVVDAGAAAVEDGHLDRPPIRP